MPPSSRRTAAPGSTTAPERPGGARTVADDVRGRTDEQLADLLLHRPDLTRPAPADLSALGARAATLASVQRAVDALDAGALAVLETLAVAGDPVDVEWAAQLAGLSVRSMTAQVRRLWARALVWHGDDGWHLPRAAVEALGPWVAGLADGATDRADVETATESLAGLSPGQRALLERLAWGPPVGVVGPESRLAGEVDKLIAAELLQPRAATGEVLLPRAVGLALRGGRLHRSVPALSPPTLPTRAVEPERADAAGGAAAGELLGLIDEIAGLWGPAPPRVLRAGGLAVADLKATAEALDLELGQTAFVVEVAYAAGLVDDDGELEPVWAPTAAYDDWQQATPESRWLTLSEAWLSTTRAAWLVGRRLGREGRGTAVNALSEGAATALGRAVRHDVLAVLAEMPPGAAATGEGVQARLSWDRPRRPAAALEEAGNAALAEAAWLGMTGYGALTTAARLLLGGAEEEAVTAAVEAALPDPVHHVLLQADLTAVAPGRLEGRLAAFLRLAADVESRGGATVYRFTPGSLRRPLDAGWDERQLLDALHGASSTGVPQPLAYLVGDVARRHGGLRVGAASSYVRSDDPLAIDDLVERRELAAYQLRRLGPGVAVAQVAPATLLSALRAAGLMPVAESSEGGVVAPPVTHRRSPARRGPHRAPYGGVARDALPAGGGSGGATAAGDKAAGPEPRDAAVLASVRQLRAGEDALMRVRAHREDVARTPLQELDPGSLASFLRDAALQARAVWMAVVDASGAPRRLRLEPTRVEGGRVHGRVDDGPERSYSLHRIAAVGPAD